LFLMRTELPSVLKVEKDTTLQIVRFLRKFSIFMNLFIIE